MLQRLSLSYAPRASKMQTLGLFALDARLAEIVRKACEPAMAQLRLAWWREAFARPVATWPSGEPLLACLEVWEGHIPALAKLVDAWEEMTAEAPMPADRLAQLGRARGYTFAALAELVGAPEDADLAFRMGQGWALVDIRQRVSHPEEQARLDELALSCDWSSDRLSRKMRPLTVLHGMARRQLSALHDEPHSLSALFHAIRLGLLGR